MDKEKEDDEVGKALDEESNKVEQKTQDTEEVADAVSKTNEVELGNEGESLDKEAIKSKVKLYLGTHFEEKYV